MQIDRLNLEGFANLDPWVLQLEQRIRTILVRRLTTEILAWCNNFQTAGQDNHQTPHDISLPVAGAETTDVRAIIPVVHEIRIRNQVLYLEPPLESAKAICLRGLHAITGTLAFAFR
jgi:dynein heavy chain 1, cytosolic